MTIRDHIGEQVPGSSEGTIAVRGQLPANLFAVTAGVPSSSGPGALFRAAVGEHQVAGWETMFA